MIRLNNQTILPIGFGTWQMGGRHEKATTNDVQDTTAIRYALGKGINFINGAEVYGGGHTDELIGEAAQGFDHIVLASKLKRETLRDPSTIRAAAGAIAQRLRRPSIDLLYVHWPYPDTDMNLYLPAMLQLVDESLVQSVGVSNFNIAQLKQAMAIAKAHGHRIAAIENVYSVLNHGGGIHPTVQLPQPGFDPEMRQYCHDNGIVMVAYTPTAKGMVRDHPVVQQIAADHQATPIQIALAWVLAQGIVPIVKSSQPSHIDENLGTLHIPLSDVEMQKLSSIAA